MNTVISKTKSCSPSFWMFWLIAVSVTILSLSQGHWNKPDKIFHDDINHYYAYLPATLIYHDIKLDFLNTNMQEFSKHFWPMQSPSGKRVLVTTMGLSLMYAPFFIIIHYPLSWMGYDATGYTAPYQFAIILGALFYFIVGIHLLRRILEKYFSQAVTAITLFTIVMATNLLYYVLDEPGMSHVFNFALITAFVYFTLRWIEKPGFLYSLILGLLAGLISLIRPTNIIIVLIIPFWGITSWQDWFNRLLLLVKRFYLVLLMMFAAVLVWTPQMLYWKEVTGHYLYFSYGDKGKFFFNNPQIINTLFSYRKGWLVYTPVITFAFAGLYFLWRKQRSLFFAIIIFLFINIWVISSWWLWWYGGSLGLRAYIDSYALVALPLAAFISWAWEKRNLLVKSLTVALVLIFSAHNFFMIEQYRVGTIDYISMTKEAYWESFGKLKKTDRFIHLLSYPDYKLAEQGIYPKPVIDPLYAGKLTRKEGIEIIRKQISSSPEMMDLVRKKAAQQGVTADEMLMKDATYVYDLKVQEGTIRPSDE